MSTAPKGYEPLEGACNELVESGLAFRVAFCHRPDNGTGMCNVHAAAKERGRRQREANAALRRRRRLAR